MKKSVVFLLGALVVMFMAGCGSSGEEAADTAAEATETAKPAGGTHTHADGTVHEGDHSAPGAAAQASMSMEMACAGCVYKMEGAQGCQPAVMVNGTPMMLKGVEVDAHGIGLCAAPKQATVAGSVKDGDFVATKVEVE